MTSNGGGTKEENRNDPIPAGCHGRSIPAHMKGNPDSAGHGCLQDLARVP